MYHIPQLDIGMVVPLSLTAQNSAINGLMRTPGEACQARFAMVQPHGLIIDDLNVIDRTYVAQIPQ